MPTREIAKVLVFPREPALALELCLTLFLATIPAALVLHMVQELVLDYLGTLTPMLPPTLVSGQKLSNPPDPFNNLMMLKTAVIAFYSMYKVCKKCKWPCFCRYHFRIKKHNWGHCSKMFIL